LRDRLLNTLIAGEKAELTANQWSPSRGTPCAAVGVAEAALDAARNTPPCSIPLPALTRLAAHMLASALCLDVGAMMAVNRRVIGPLHNMRDAMLKVASAI